MNLFLPSVKLLKKVRVGSKVRRVYDGPRTPFERVQACPQADPHKLAQLEHMRQSLDPFQLSRSIEGKLERISRFANRRLSPQPEAQTAPQTTPSTRRANGGGKDARSASLEIAKRFPLSHRRNNNKAPVTFPMSRQPQLRLHS
jgi:hypothetical protein